MRSAVIHRIKNANSTQPPTPKRLKLSSSEVATFCQRGQITELFLFSSILRDDFRPESDIDILQRFSPKVRQGLLTLAKIKHELEEQIESPVVALKESVENWICRDEILQTAQMIYEQR